MFLEVHSHGSKQGSLHKHTHGSLHAKHTMMNQGGKNIGVIRIRSFSQTTAETVAKELDKLEKSGISAVVIDLRGNPGGFLGGGIDTARLFLPSTEKIVSVSGRTGIVEDYQTTDDGMYVCVLMYAFVYVCIMSSI